MSIENIDNYIKAKCIDPRTQRDEYAAYVLDGLQLNNTEARQLIGYMVEIQNSTVPLTIAKLSMRVVAILNDRLQIEYAEQANEFAHEQSRAFTPNQAWQERMAMESGVAAVGEI